MASVVDNNIVGTSQAMHTSWEARELKPPIYACLTPQTGLQHSKLQRRRRRSAHTACRSSRGRLLETIPCRDPNPQTSKSGTEVTDRNARRQAPREARREPKKQNHPTRGTAGAGKPLLKERVEAE